MYEINLILEDDKFIDDAELMVTIPVRVYDHLVRRSEQVDAVKRMYYRNKGILCTSDVVAILGIEKYKEENEDA